MGERDRQERQEIEGTLRMAWSEWVEGISWQPQDQFPANDRGPLQYDRGPLQYDRGPLQYDRGPLQYDSDPECDREDEEEKYDTLAERNNGTETFSSFYDDIKSGT